MNTSLREALAERIDAVGPARPDLDALVRLGETRLRRRRRTTLATVAAAAVLVAGGGYGVTKLDSDTAVRPAGTSHTTTPQTYRAKGGSDIAPGTYRMPVGVDDTGAAVDANLTFDHVWLGGIYPATGDGTGKFGGVAVYQPLALAAGTGCQSDPPNTQVGQTPHQLAQQLAQLPQSTVIQSPTRMQKFGGAVHLQLRIISHCGSNDWYRVAETPRGDHGITYGFKPRRPVLIDFWVKDVEGTPIVVETWHQDGLSRHTVDQIARTRDSITFVIGR
jgi:hypothetical protein